MDGEMEAQKEVGLLPPHHPVPPASVVTVLFLPLTAILGIAQSQGSRKTELYLVGRS